MLCHLWKAPKLAEAQDIDWNQFIVLTILFCAISWAWSTPVVYPLRLLVVFMHEASHAAAVIATGGSVERIEVNAEEGGMCVHAGGNLFIILNAGYLGSLCCGGMILQLGCRADWGRLIAVSLGAGISGIGLHWVRPIYSFGMIFTMLAGALLVLSGLRFPPELNGIVLRLIGLTSCMYAVIDIKSDILDRPTVPSDAALLAAHTGVPTLVWGVLWIVLALSASVSFAVLAVQRVPSGGASGRWLLSSKHSSTRLPFYGGVR
mmetsp:Transcript_34243/g.78057  ORF Transcript_34243/g.78057 Transcript_34243/m.78057 type:complete len:262 (-) Transcript_34243:110-895(-)